MPWRKPSVIPPSKLVKLPMPDTLRQTRRLQLPGTGPAIERVLLLQNRLVVQGTDTGLYEVGVFDTKSGQTVARGVRRDAGNGRVATYTSFAPDKTDSSAFWALEFYTHRFVRFIIERDGTIQQDRHIVFRVHGALNSPQWTDDGLLTEGFFGRGLLASFTDQGKPRELVGIPPVVSDTVPVDLRHHLNYGILASNPSHRAFAVAYQVIPQLDIVKADGTPVARLLREDSTTFPWPKAVVTPSGIRRFGVTKGARTGFLAAVGTNGHVYALFGGGAFDPKRMNDARQGTHIMRVKWDGTVDGELVLPAPAAAIAVSADEREVFAVPVVGNAIAVYTLPTAGATQLLGQAAKHNTVQFSHGFTDLYEFPGQMAHLGLPKGPN